MQSQPLLLRIPVVIFAVLVGGIFVYARSGGSIGAFNRPAQPARAPVQDPNEPGGGPAIMMGSKSAPAFLPEEKTRQSVQAQPKVVEATPRAMLLPGSKSAVVVPQSDASSLPVVQPVAPTNNIAPSAANNTNVPRPAPRLLPGSKSVILVDPQSQPPPPKQQAVRLPRFQPVQPAPRSSAPSNLAPRNNVQQPANNRGVER